MFGCGCRGLHMIINSRSEGGRHINLDRGLTSTPATGAANEGSRRFHNYRDGPY